MLIALPGGAHAFTTFWGPSSGLKPNEMPCPWTLVNNTPNAPQMANGVLTISTNTTGANSTWYQQTGAALLMPSDSLIVLFGVRCVSSGTSSTARAGVSLVLETSAFRGVGIFINTTEIFWDANTTTRGGTATATNNDVVHDYRVVVILATNAVRIYRDGTLILLGTTHVDSSSGDFAGFARILWGEGSSLALGTSDWAYFSHNASPGTACGTTAAPHPTWGGLKSIYR